LEKQFILITGVSGSGKTEYGQYLELAHEFLFIETDKCIPFIEIATSPENPLQSDLVRRYVDMLGLVVVEWGFQVRFLDHVIALNKQGGKLFWFTAPDECAFPAYLRKWGDSQWTRRAWKLQRESQRKAGLPTAHFQTIETTRPDGSFKTHEELDKQILGQGAYGSVRDS
jgi:hypothetical protein